MSSLGSFLTCPSLKRARRDFICEIDLGYA